MVDVRMREQHEIECGRIEPEAAAIAVGRLAPALEHPAVDQEADFRRFDRHAGAGDLAGGAKEAQLHRR